MTTRTTSRTITFRHPFMLSEFEAPQPAGTYIVDTEEALLDTLTRPAYLRLRTAITVYPDPSNHRVQDTIVIDPLELDEALARDARIVEFAGQITLTTAR